MTDLLAGTELLVHYRREILDYIKKIQHWWNFGSERIVVLGAAGVGKTTLGHILAGEILTAAEKYQESINIEAFSYKGKIFGSVIVAPGQERRRRQNWPDIKNQISEGKVSGIIFVTAGGFNSLREIEPEDHQIYQMGMSDADFIQKYAQHNLLTDAQIIQDELSECLCNARGRIWFVTLVLKKDLWHQYERSTMSFYTSGPYSEAIAKIIGERGQKEFVHECLSGSLLIENLVSKKGRVMAQTTAGFDAAKQMESLRDLSRAISELAMDKEFRET